jgi:hypothetical protein
VSICRFVIDSDTLIRSKREHYAFDICPGFWEALECFSGRGHLCSIIPVKQELLRVSDDLADWIRTHAPADFFAPVDGAEVVEAFRQVMMWVNSQSQYQPAAREHFAAGADPWLVAYAAVNKCTLVTYEQSRPKSQNSVKIPDAAAAFRVRCCPVHEMLSYLRTELVLVPPIELSLDNVGQARSFTPDEAGDAPADITEGDDEIPAD